MTLLYDWKFWARPKQLIPVAAFFCWLLLSGRGWGKTRTGSEFILERVRQGYKRIALVGQTKADVRDTMVELGDSSILKVVAPWERPKYIPSKRRLVWLNKDGSEKAVAIFYSGDEPDQLRGPQHDTAWVDELAKFKYPKDTWDNLEFGLRLSNNPQVIVTTTPRPIPILKEIIADDSNIVEVGHTEENLANLAPSFVKRVYKKYGGTRIGRQELAGEILDDNPNALWRRAWIEDLRTVKAPDLKRIIVAVDPQGTNELESAETGIVVAGVGVDEHGYILADCTVKGSPDEWGRAAVTAYNTYSASKIVGEVDNGGDMIEFVIRSVQKGLSYGKVRATRGKQLRAEPISALYEQKKIHHVGAFPQLEDQMCEWVPGDKSPDRLDALVWALTELMLDSTSEFLIG